MPRQSSRQSLATVPSTPVSRSRSSRAANVAPTRRLRSTPLPATPLPARVVPVTPPPAASRIRKDKKDKKDKKGKKDAAIDKPKSADVNVNVADKDSDSEDDSELDFAQVSLMDRDPGIWTSCETMGLLKWMCCHPESKGRTQELYQDIVAFTKSNLGVVVTVESVKTKIRYFRMKYREAAAMASSTTISGYDLLERQEKHCPPFTRLHTVFDSKKPSFFKSKPFFELPAPTSKSAVNDASPSQPQLPAPTSKAGNDTHPRRLELLSPTRRAANDKFPSLNLGGLTDRVIGKPIESSKHETRLISHSSLPGSKALSDMSKDSALQAFALSDLLTKRERTAKIDLENEMRQKRRCMEAEFLQDRVRHDAEMAKERQVARLEAMKDWQFLQIEISKGKNILKRDRAKFEEEKETFRKEKETFRKQKETFLLGVNAFVAQMK